MLKRKFLFQLLQKLQPKRTHRRDKNITSLHTQAVIIAMILLLIVTVTQTKIILIMIVIIIMIITRSTQRAHIFAKVYDICTILTNWHNDVEIWIKDLKVDSSSQEAGKVLFDLGGGLCFLDYFQNLLETSLSQDNPW